MVRKEHFQRGVEGSIDIADATGFTGPDPATIIDDTGIGARIRGGGRALRFDGNHS